MDSKTIRNKFIKFFTDKGHKEIALAKLVPENDPTTLFTSSGMQPLIPYLLGQVHQEGKRLVNSQPCFRAEDIEEVGDNRHTTFFEMLGNWSLGDYFKEDQLKWCWEFLTKELGLPKEKLYVSVFEGNSEVPKDNETYEIYKNLGVNEDHIYFYDVDKNWWSRSGPPDKMPVGEIGGPDSEVFYDFATPHDEKYGKECHPNCNCGRFLEIGNSVFIQYQKQKDGSLKELSQKNVDFGGGLERLTTAVNNAADIFQTDLYLPIIKILEEFFDLSYKESEISSSSIRIITDHLKGSVVMASVGVIPSNKLQGYVMRRLIRRAMVKVRGANIEEALAHSKPTFVRPIVEVIGDIYQDIIPEINNQKDQIAVILETEINGFQKTLERGLNELGRLNEITGKAGFDLYQTYGFPLELTEELAKDRGLEINKKEFYSEFEKHRELSRTASAGMFKGGLADHSEVVTKYHTATHLLHQALRDVLGPQVFQKGSNVTAERLRFDFSFDRKMTDEEIKQTEDIVNERIREDLKVDHMIIPLDQAKEMNAIGLFDEKYADKVSIYGVGSNFKLDPEARDTSDRDGYYSLEFCGGPHVEHTSVIGKIKITKEEAISAGMRRVRAQIV